MKRLMLLPMLLATAGWAQIKWPNELMVWFPDGTGLEIHTETSGGNAPVSTTGSVASWGNDSHRVVLDKNGAVLFGYDIEASRIDKATFAVRIKPSREAIRLTCCVDGKKSVEYMPTVAAVRDFPPLHVGDAVQVDILHNPSTGEKIYDVLKVSGSRPPTAPAAKPAPQRFSLQDVRVAIDGKTIVEQQGIWMVGGAVMVHLPGRGEFYMALAPPPPDLPRFQPAGWVDHHVLRFHAGSELVEITSKTNVLQNAEYGTVWVYQNSDLAKAERLQQALTEARRKYTAKHPDVIALEKAAAELALDPKLAAAANAGLDLAAQRKLSKLDRGIEFHCYDDVELLLKTQGH